MGGTNKLETGAAGGEVDLGALMGFEGGKRHSEDSGGDSDHRLVERLRERRSEGARENTNVIRQSLGNDAAVEGPYGLLGTSEWIVGDHFEEASCKALCS